MGIPWTQAKVVNTSDNPIPVSPLGVESFFATRAGTMPASTTEELYQTVKPSVIEILEVAGDAANAPQVRIYARQPNGSFQNMTMINGRGSAALAMVPSQLQADGCALFDLTAYDTTSNSYKFVLNRPLAFPRGFRITISNVAGAEKNVGASIYGRLLT